MSDINTSTPSLVRTIGTAVLYPMLGVSCIILFVAMMSASSINTVNAMIAGYAMFLSIILFITVGQREQLLKHWSAGLPHVAVIGTTVTLLVLLGIYQLSIAHGQVAPQFYPYFGIATLSTVLSLGALMSMTKVPNLTPETKSLLWNLAMFLATLTTGSIVILNIVLSCYATQG
jgi:hypothetical protein